MFFSPSSIAITSLGKNAGMCAFCAFVCFARNGLSLFPLLLGVMDWLPFVIVALRGLFFLSIFIVGFVILLLLYLSRG